MATSKTATGQSARTQRVRIANANTAASSAAIRRSKSRLDGLFGACGGCSIEGAGRRETTDRGGHGNAPNNRHHS